MRDRDGPYGLRKAVEGEVELAVVDSYYKHFLHASMRNSLVVLTYGGQSTAGETEGTPRRGKFPLCVWELDGFRVNRRLCEGLGLENGEVRAN